MERKAENLRLDEAQDPDFTDILAKHNLKLSELFSYLAKSAYVNQRTGNLVELRPVQFRLQGPALGAAEAGARSMRKANVRYGGPVRKVVRSGHSLRHA
jgi:hypothetical protein